MNNIPYDIFSKFILRVPIFSLTKYNSLTSGKYITDEQFKDLCNNFTFLEAIYLASPDLYLEVEKWINNKIENTEKIEKIKFSVLKYFSRIASRCTPYGLFAGCCLGEFSDEDNIILENTGHARHTRLDMNYLVSLSQHLTKNDLVKREINFYPNNSLYNVGDKMRYVEYFYQKGHRHYNIASIDSSEYIEKVLSKSIQGSTIDELVSVLVDDDITEEIARNFVHDLIGNQILISELEPSVTGLEFIYQLQKIFSDKLIKVNIQSHEVLNIINHKLNDLDKKIGNKIEKYTSIENKIKELGVDYNKSHLFQTDLLIKTQSNKLSKSLIKDIKKAISFINAMSLDRPRTDLDAFKEAFYERYENREMPLSFVLDNETGIGYGRHVSLSTVSPLLEGLPIVAKSNNSRTNVSWSKSTDFFYYKILDSLKNKSTIIKLSDKDLDSVNTNWEDLPDTFSSMIEIISGPTGIKYKVDSFGGSSAANLVARFCHGDENLFKFTEEIINVEEKMNHDKIIAEIVHLPQDRVGNILSRPSIRKTEIPYLTKSMQTRDHQINISDLMLSIKNNRLVLRSKKFNKEVIPKNTNAYNYSNNPLPIFQFLCDMQIDNKRGSAWLDLDFLAGKFKYIPRIEYGNIILQNATWYLTKEDVSELLKSKDGIELENNIEFFLKKYNIPDQVILVEGDNELLINMNNFTSVKMLLDSVKNKKHFQLKEFLFMNDDGLVKDQNNEKYTNQFILSFYNKNKIQNN